MAMAIIMRFPEGIILLEGDSDILEEFRIFLLAEDFSESYEERIFSYDLPSIEVANEHLLMWDKLAS